MTLPRAIIAAGLLALMALWGGVACAKPAIFHPAPDVTAPTMQSATLASNGTSLTVPFDEAVAATNANGFTLTASGGDVTLTLSSGSGTSSLVFTASRTIYSGELLSLAYSTVAGNVTDIPANALADDVLTVTNNSTEEPPPGGVEISSATINSAGTTLTVVLSGNATITNATGWSVTFDNLASRTLTYTSGSGSSTLVFTFAAVSPSTDGRAPVGTTCSLEYDADTGNVSDLADAIESVTNNSTVIPDPDLPQNVPTAALPDNWDDAADHSPANNAALQELLDGDGSGDVAAGDVISLDADVDYGTINIDDAVQGSDGNWIIIRSDEYASLPTFDLDNATGRVTTDDEQYMATISRTPSVSNHAALNFTPDGKAHTGSNNASVFTYASGTWVADELVGLTINNIANNSSGVITANTATTITATLAGATENDWDTNDVAVITGHTQVPHHIRLIGVKVILRGSFSSDVLSGIGTLSGGFGAHKDTLPHHIGFDRCTGTFEDAMKGVQDFIRFDMDDSFVAGCNFYNLYGAGNDGSNALRSYSAHRLLVKNNYFECMGGSYFTGDNNFREVEDVTYENNHQIRPTAWDDGLHGVTKASYETKVGLRLSVINNIFENQFTASSDAGFAVVSIKAEGTGGPKKCSHLTIRGTKINNAIAGMFVSSAGSSTDGDVGPNSDVLIEDSLVVNTNFSLRLISATPAGVLERIQVLNNTFINSTAYSVWMANIDSGNTPSHYLLYRDNIHANGVWPNGGGEGSQAFNWAFNSTYSATYNLFVGRAVGAYDNDASPAPLGTLDDNIFPANIAAVGFTDSGAGDYSISEASAYKNSSSTGGKPGYDAATWDALWLEIEQ